MYTVLDIFLCFSSNWRAADTCNVCIIYCEWISKDGFNSNALSAREQTNAHPLGTQIYFTPVDLILSTVAYWMRPGRKCTSRESNTDGNCALRPQISPQLLHTLPWLRPPMMQVHHMRRGNGCGQFTMARVNYCVGGQPLVITAIQLGEIRGR
jgi:hypothetical protein